MENEKINNVLMKKGIVKHCEFNKTGEIDNGKSKTKSVRMCIVCKKRELQKNLIRLQCFEKKLVFYKGVGRSFYICFDCINTKNAVNKISRLCKTQKEEIKKRIEDFSFSILH